MYRINVLAIQLALLALSRITLLVRQRPYASAIMDSTTTAITQSSLCII